MCDKSIIIKHTYQRDSIQFHAYTAEWCKPCQKIKPKVIELMTGNGYDFIESIEIQKSEFKNTINEYIPYFEVHNGGIKIDSIQTSNEVLFINFLRTSGIIRFVLTDDF